MAEGTPGAISYNSRLVYDIPIEHPINGETAAKNGSHLAEQLYPVKATLSGQLSADKVINEALDVVIDYEDDEYIVSEPRFHIHGTGPTQNEAIAAFMRIISQIYDDLSEEADHLSKRMQAQLSYLQSKITIAR